ncbi:MAG: hypothetical protein AAGJ35_12240, partial [Myxococcota bacterium]
ASKRRKKKSIVEDGTEDDVLQLQPTAAFILSSAPTSPENSVPFDCEPDTSAEPSVLVPEFEL